MNRSQTSPAGHTPRAEDDDPNAPWLPKIPGPRRPSHTPAGAR